MGHFGKQERTDCIYEEYRGGNEFAPGLFHLREMEMEANGTSNLVTLHGRHLENIQL